MAKRLTTKTVTLPGPAKGLGPFDPACFCREAAIARHAARWAYGATRKPKSSGLGPKAPAGPGGARSCCPAPIPWPFFGSIYKLGCPGGLFPAF